MASFLVAMAFVGFFWVLGLLGSTVFMLVRRDFFMWGLQLTIGFAVGNFLGAVVNLVFKAAGVWQHFGYA